MRTSWMYQVYTEPLGPARPPAIHCIAGGQGLGGRAALLLHIPIVDINFIIQEKDF